MSAEAARDCVYLQTFVCLHSASTMQSKSGCREKAGLVSAHCRQPRRCRLCQSLRTWIVLLRRVDSPKSSDQLSAGRSKIESQSNTCPEGTCHFQPPVTTGRLEAEPSQRAREEHSTRKCASAGSRCRCGPLGTAHGGACDEAQVSSITSGGELQNALEHHGVLARRPRYHKQRRIKPGCPGAWTTAPREAAGRKHRPQHHRGRRHQ